jgi:hypothetical protein
MNKYTFNLTCICPNDKETISYKAVIETQKMIMVEDINDYIYSLSDKEMFQESLTDKILAEFSVRNALPRVHVTTFGTHQGVKIKCEKGNPFK